MNFTAPLDRINIEEGKEICFLSLFPISSFLPKIRDCETEEATIVSSFPIMFSLFFPTSIVLSSIQLHLAHRQTTG